MKIFYFLSIFLFLSISCQKQAHKDKKMVSEKPLNLLLERNNNVLNIKEIEEDFYNDRFFYIEYINKEIYDSLLHCKIEIQLDKSPILFKEDKSGLSIYLINGDSIVLSNDDGIESESSIELNNYEGYIESKYLHVFSKKLYESKEYYLVKSSTGEIYRLNGIPSFHKESNLFFTTSSYLGIEGMPNGLYLYSIDNKSIKLRLKADILDWIPDIRSSWINKKALFLKIDYPYSEKKTRSSKYAKIEIISLEKRDSILETKPNWYDVFSLYPFDEGSGNIGNYYLQIEKDKESDFATSFGTQDIEFNYKGYPILENDTLYFIDKDSPRILAKITKVEDQYYIKSDLIEVFSDYIKPSKYGYKLKKGFPED